MIDGWMDRWIRLYVLVRKDEDIYLFIYLSVG